MGTSTLFFTANYDTFYLCTTKTWVNHTWKDMLEMGFMVEECTSKSASAKGKLFIHHGQICQDRLQHFLIYHQGMARRSSSASSKATAPLLPTDTTGPINCHHHPNNDNSGKKQSSLHLIFSKATFSSMGTGLVMGCRMQQQQGFVTLLQKIVSINQRRHDGLYFCHYSAGEKEGADKNTTL
eukprot:1814859-Ditylum_brightwellii.AAC.1